MIEIACAADLAYVPHAAAMMQSVLPRHRRGAVRFHVLHDHRLPAPARERLRSMAADAGASLAFHGIAAERVDGLPEMGRISRVMWYRIFLPELLPRAQRVLYLDCDTLAMDDLRPLFDADLAGRALGAVANVFEPAQADHAEAIGLSAGAYFNSGVLLLDLDAWRRENATARLLGCVRSHGTRLTWPDQDALNLVFANRWHALHPRWNAQNSFYFFPEARDTFGARLDEALARPGILHFEGGGLAKPWHYLCKHPRRDEYARCRALTPFAPLRLEGASLLNRLLRPLPLRWLLPTLRFVDRVRGLARRHLPQPRVAA